VADDVPLELPGYDFVREIGQGGFADVYLVRQRMPSRDVAVKVLRQTAASAADRDQFENEANRMAMLSSHPGIVTIYEVGVTPDDRPYLTMEYCPHDHFGRIARAHPLTVARALEVGIKVAAAVETAHQASILHRDVKPANILLTTYGEPALADFGIAGGTDGDGLSANQGVSIPFAAPEVLSGATVGDELSDVYSLGATVYALLAGRAPFSTGEPTTEAQLIERILHAPLPPTGRAEVPPSLERALATAIARDPSSRYDSAAAFGRALQGVEAELGLAQTPLRIADTTAIPERRARDDGDEDSTRLTSLQRVDPDGPPKAPDVPIVGVPSATGVARPARADVQRSAWEPESQPHDSSGGLGDHTVARGAPEGEPDSALDGVGDDPSESVSNEARRRRIAVSVGAGLVVLVAVVFVLSRAGDQVEQTGTTTTTASGDGLVVPGAPPRPEDVQIEPSDAGGQVVSWEVASSADGDAFQVVVTQGPADLEGERIVVEEAELDLDTEDRVCVTVETIREGRVSAVSTEVCSP
jgi:eukaryotic-like serine/threonine-protein kinase